MTHYLFGFNESIYNLGVTILILHLVTTGTSGQVQECSNDWTQIEDSCYALLHSTDFYGFRSVYEARRMCNKHGGDLASLETREIHLDLFKMVRILPKDVRPKRVYIGLEDTMEEGQYHWLDGQNVTFVYWGPDEPNNLYKNNEDCVLLDSQSGRWEDDGSTGWKDYPCCSRDLVAAVFCERSINSSGDPVVINDFTNPLAKACFKDRNECLSDPCTQGGICKDKFLDYNCVCPDGLTGKNCESDVHCEAVPSWADYNISTRDTLYRTILNYTCSDEDYKFLDELPFKFSECNATGKWEPPFAPCAIPEKERKPIHKMFTQPTEAVGAPAVGSLAIIFMVVELSFLILLDLDYFIRELGTLCTSCSRMTKKNNNTGEEAETVGEAGEEGARPRGRARRALCCAIPGSRYIVTAAEAQPSSSREPEHQMENGSVDSKF